MTDGLGLFLLVHPNGGRYWRLKYRFDGKEKLLPLGAYPEIGLKEARERRDAARSILADGRDPGAVKHEQKQAAALKEANAFEIVAREFVKKQAKRWTEHYTNDVIRRLELNIFPDLGMRPIAEITPPELLTTIRKLEARGATERVSLSVDIHGLLEELLDRGRLHVLAGLETAVVRG